MVEGFKFSLQTLLRLRKQDRDEQRRVVAQAIRAVAGSQARVSLLTGDLRETVSSVRSEQQDDSLNLVAMRRHQFYRSWLHQQIIDAENEVAENRQLLDQQRAKLAEATKQLKVVEALRDKKLARYNEKMTRALRIEEDEIGAAMFLRNQRRSTGETLV